MKLNISYLAYLLSASTYTVSAMPSVVISDGAQQRSVPFTLSARAADAACGQGCSTQADCSGTCSFCSTPAEYRWQCLEPSVQG
ncbi:hypothetical protein F4779DRAFT_609609 [Xylariaceae sp. FL0662B]|nr:hypothetical protein F4779DRAFT_609609 [Xylariaceae sp. FL0662B]